MSIHIYIATTQGLVAVQNITVIDDEDISSVVSINGTSTIANISSSYHNFVKKGVGIIQQMFGACSYRVDISQRIDQGNSWQVGIYAAHLAHSKKVLGKGQVRENDTVICATGEVNTTNLQVLAVAQVAIKLELAKEQLKQWTALGADVHFLLPQANQHDIHAHSSVQLITHLQQVAELIPNAGASVTQASVPSRGTWYTKPSYLGALAIVAVILAAMLLLIPQPAPQFEIALAVQPIVNIPAGSKVSLLSKQKTDQGCAHDTSVVSTATDNTDFAPLRLSGLCSLYLATHQATLTVLLVAQDARTVLPLENSNLGWKIPLPNNRLTDRSYVLVTFKQILSEEKIALLRRYRQDMPKIKQQNQQWLKNWLTKQALVHHLYQHTLLID
jgi:hypothetical protein